MTAWDAFSNRYPDETCLVIGNGPSLRDVPLDFLRKYKSFGTNRIYLLDGFKPSFYCSVNPLVLEQSLPQIIEADYPVSFVRAEYADRIPGAMPLISTGLPHFSREPQKCIYEGHTVTYVCLQLAFFMGFSTVLLVGVDHSYQYQGAPNQEQVAGWESDPNHFAPNYFSGDTRWHNPDLVRSERAYHMARTVFEHAGRRIVNLGPNSKLDIFERGEVGQW